MMDQIYNIATTVTIPDIELTFEGIVTLLFNICCGILYLIGEATGMGYELANLLIFVIVHPLTTLLFFYLWRKSQAKNKVWKELSKINPSNQTSVA